MQEAARTFAPKYDFGECRTLGYLSHFGNTLSNFTTPIFFFQIQGLQKKKKKKKRKLTPLRI